MKEEIEEFFFSRNLPVDRLIDLGQQRHGVEKRFVQQAISQLYSDITEGRLEIARQRVAWEIWDRAKWLRSEDRKVAHLGEPKVMVSQPLPIEVPPAAVIIEAEKPSTSKVTAKRISSILGPVVAFVGLAVAFAATYWR